MPFFMRMQEPQHNAGFLDQVKSFVQRIKKRADEKRKEMDAADVEDHPENYEEMTKEERKEHKKRVKEEKVFDSDMESDGEY